MRRHLLAAAFTALAAPAGAQLFAAPEPYCGGNVVADWFETRHNAGARGRTEYYVRMSNQADRTVRFQITVNAAFNEKPPGRFTLPRGQREVISLGNTPPGQTPTRRDRLKDAIQVSCG